MNSSSIGQDQMHEGSISVITPSFNAAATIERTVHSVLSQLRPGDELIVQDGGSTDDTLEILMPLAEQAPVRIATEIDKGQSDALNKGLARARGAIIGWLNADDLYTDDALELVRETFRRDPTADVVFGDWAMADGEGTILRRYRLADWEWERVYRRGLYVFSGATFFRRRVFDVHGGFDPSLRFCMDMDFMLRIGRATRWVRLPELLALFRVHEESKTSSFGLGFIREAHRVRVRHAGGSSRLYLLNLRCDLREAALTAARPLRWSSGWSRIRSQKNL